MEVAPLIQNSWDGQLSVFEQILDQGLRNYEILLACRMAARRDNGAAFVISNNDINSSLMGLVDDLDEPDVKSPAALLYELESLVTDERVSPSLEIQHLAGQILHGQHIPITLLAFAQECHEIVGESMPPENLILWPKPAAQALTEIQQTLFEITMLIDEHILDRINDIDTVRLEEMRDEMRIWQKRFHWLRSQDYKLMPRIISPLLGDEMVPSLDRAYCVLQDEQNMLQDMLSNHISEAASYGHLQNEHNNLAGQVNYAILRLGTAEAHLIEMRQMMIEQNLKSLGWPGVPRNHKPLLLELRAEMEEIAKICEALIKKDNELLSF